VLKDPGVEPGIIALGGSTEFPAGGTAISWDALYALPTDSQALTRILRADIKDTEPNDDADRLVQ
jgi:hypothetical protein